MVARIRRVFERCMLNAVESACLHLPRGTIGNRLRWALINACGGSVQWPLHIDSGVWVRFPNKMRAGRGLVISRGSVLNCAGGLTFGDYCLVGYSAYIGTNAHVIPNRLDQPVALAGHSYDPVVIGDGCWLGAHSCVLPGVVLGQGCVVGAGAVVTDSFEAGSVIAGVPARVLRVRCAGRRG